ncbi:MAG: hypothetical protein K1X68_05110 [Saprospiraceae bacterium]|nr:hypothetical protein [Saprospiraceae bacterium]HMW38673.1 hypothetical protein [Saprospiraceae bacterium]HMX88195.1 hypothetical protein [Saprospiraceae bacterium]HMZ39933.1 hypothetical protein [Saprospiraceae bacterium]HNA63889.1 hypothetical protein [Saprospiraceae bacterium]
MNLNRLFFATVIGAIVFFLSGALIYGMFLQSILNKLLTAEATAALRAAPELSGIASSCVIFAFALAYIYERWTMIRNWKSGALAGSVIACAMAVSIDLGLSGIYNMFADMSYIMYDGIGNLLMGALTGAAIGWYLGYNRQVG